MSKKSLTKRDRRKLRMIPQRRIVLEEANQRQSQTTKKKEGMHHTIEEKKTN